MGGPAGPTRCAIRVASDAALRRLSAGATLLDVGELYVAGEIDVEGDLLAAVEIAYAADGAMPQRSDASAVPASREADRGAIAHHYDLSNEFYALFLDRRMVYSCAYYRTPDADLDAAQLDKLDLVCRKLRLAPDERLLDVGCGWGALVIRAAEQYAARVHGVTLSAAQAAYAQGAIRQAGLDGRAAVTHRDFRDVSRDERFDKIAAVGVIEHVGPGRFAELFERARTWLPPGGRFLVQGITRSAGRSPSNGLAFLSRHVFPGLVFATTDEVRRSLESAGFDVLDVEALSAHYSRTLRQWLARLQGNAARACALVGERTFRTWAIYLAAAAVGFDVGAIGVHQFLASRRPVATSGRAMNVREP